VVKDAQHWVVGRWRTADVSGAADRRFDLWCSNMDEGNLRAKFIAYMITALDNGGTPVDAVALADFKAGNFAPYDIRLMDPRLLYPGNASLI
jgi:hypothetical protein